jgi:hypothetical protein
MSSSSQSDSRRTHLRNASENEISARFGSWDLGRILAAEVGLGQTQTLVRRLPRSA